jgi:hypothetical protein
MSQSLRHEESTLYRFVDDQQKVTLYSYGLRLMIEADVHKPGDWEERQRAASISLVGVITGTNPEIHRQIQPAELKKGAVVLLSGSLFQFPAFNQENTNTEPVINDQAAVGQSGIISFYEHAFEWEQTTYTLYPYFWGRHPWINAFTGDGLDPMHDAFLEVGPARAVVPVRPKFEQVEPSFLATGRVLTIFGDTQPKSTP